MNCGGRCLENIIERAENELQRLLEGLAAAHHVALNGSTDQAAIVYRISGEDTTYESGVPILTRIRAQIYVYQREYTARLVWEIRTALEAYGWSVRIGAQALDGDCYRDEMNIGRVFVGKEDENE